MSPDRGLCPNAWHTMPHRVSTRLRPSTAAVASQIRTPAAPIMSCSQWREPAWPPAQSASTPAGSVHARRRIEDAAARQWADERQPGQRPAAWAWLPPISTGGEVAACRETDRVWPATSRRNILEHRLPCTRPEPIVRWPADRQCACAKYLPYY